MKKALIIYYSQTGQLKKIVDSVTSPLREDFELVFEELKPVPAYPFPWRGLQFYQAFPESVQQIPCALEPLSFNADQDFDLVILAYQVWYLSPSIPFSAFLQSPAAGKVMKGKPVVTILGVRNMWIMAQESVKKQIRGLGGTLVGNIVLVDPHPNLVSLVTIVLWMSKGVSKGKGLISKLFPPAGVPEPSIREAAKFGEVIREAFRLGQTEKLQGHLLEKGALKVNPILMSIEKRGRMMFEFWSKFALKKGGPWDPAREFRLKLFKYYLFSAGFLLPPLISSISWFTQKIFYKKTKRLQDYYSQVK
ncbi:MAG: dialkylresorcinol condensing enzyme DarA [Deltaproteobacteria bacterium]|nr:dialkylresorcinol condensing enzyme DarA [Deltaproteobacteria bacterium]